MAGNGAALASGGSRCLQFEVERIDTYALPYPIRSPSMAFGKGRFRFLIYPRGSLASKSAGRSLGSWMSVFLEADPQDSLIPTWAFPNVKYSITLVNRLSGDRNIIKGPDTWTFCKEQIDRGWHQFAKFSDLMDEDAGWLGPNNSILIRGSVICDISEDEWTAMQAAEAKARSSLSIDFSNLWSSGWKTDVTLRAGGRDLKAHSLILASRSPVFKQMLSSGMVETSTRVVDICDIDPDVLNHLCGFIYSGVVEESVWDDDESISGLIRAASKYELRPLMDLCAERATGRISVESAAHWLRVAAELNSEGLKAYCITFIAENLSEVRATAGWEQLMQDKNMVFEVAPLLLQSVTPPPAKKART